MGKILLLTDILEKAFEQENVCLFGKRNFATIGQEKYDFFYEYLEDINRERLVQKNNLVMIPILDYKYSSQEKEAKIYMAQLYNTKNFLDTFALKNNSREGVYGKFLELYHIKKIDSRTEIGNIDYSLITKESLSKYVPNWREKLDHFKA